MQDLRCLFTNVKIFRNCNIFILVEKLERIDRCVVKLQLFSWASEGILLHAGIVEAKNEI